MAMHKQRGRNAMENDDVDGPEANGRERVATLGPYGSGSTLLDGPEATPIEAGNLRATTSDREAEIFGQNKKATGGDVDSDEWSTPPALFEALNARYGPFDFDLFASDFNKKCEAFFSKEQNSLNQPWIGLGKSLFGNPPYSKGEVGHQLRGNQLRATSKARETTENQRIRVTLILQACTDTELFHDIIMRGTDIMGKETITQGPLEGVLISLEATRCHVKLHLLRGRVAFCHPLNGKPVGSGRTGTMIVSFHHRRW